MVIMLTQFYLICYEKQTKGITMTNSPTLSYHSLLPFCAFVFFFIGSAILQIQISPLFMCVMAIGVGLTIFPRGYSFNKRMEIALHGSAQPTIVAMCFIFIFSAVFTHICTLIGGLEM